MGFMIFLTVLVVWLWNGNKKNKKNNLEINSYDVLNTELKNKEIIQLLEWLWMHLAKITCSLL